MKDLIISPRLSRAARALLDWQQIDLATHAGLSLSAVKDFEAGSAKTRPNTQKTIQNTLENNGIEFPSSGGVRAIDDVATITRFTGPTFMQKWNDDIFQSCTDPRQEILTSSTDEQLWSSPLVVQANQQFLTWLKQSQTTLKSLIPEGHKTFNLPKKCYRFVPASMLGKITYCLYADRLAFILWKKKQIIVIRNKSIVETFRSQFDYLWRLGKTLAA